MSDNKDPMDLRVREISTKKKVAKLRFRPFRVFKTHLYLGEKGGYPYSSQNFSQEGGLEG